MGAIPKLTQHRTKGFLPIVGSRPPVWKRDFAIVPGARIFPPLLWPALVVAVLLGVALPDKGWWFVPAYLIRELPGILLLAGYFVLGPMILRGLFFKKLYGQMGFARYSVMVMLMLVMLLMPIKMVLRWTLNLHYIVGITEWFLNV